MNCQYDKNLITNMNIQFIDMRFLSCSLFTCSNNSLLIHFIDLLRIKNILQKFTFGSVQTSNTFDEMISLGFYVTKK